MNPGTGLAIIASQHSSLPVLRLQGELDASNRDRLRRAISIAVECHPPVLVLDLSELAFTDCGGLSVLVWAHKRLAERGYQLVITGATPMVRRLLHLTGLDTYLHLGNTESTFPKPRQTGPCGTTVIPGRAAGAVGNAHADLEPR